VNRRRDLPSGGGIAIRANSDFSPLRSGGEGELNEKIDCETKKAGQVVSTVCETMRREGEMQAEAMRGRRRKKRKGGKRDEPFSSFVIRNRRLNSVPF
jgi:hypothetical protein